MKVQKKKKAYQAKSWK